MSEKEKENLSGSYSGSNLVIIGNDPRHKTTTNKNDWREREVHGEVKSVVKEYLWGPDGAEWVNVIPPKQYYKMKRECHWLFWLSVLALFIIWCLA